MIIGAVITAPILVFYFFNNPTESSFFPKCIFNKITGWYCPGCGVQRAFHALLHGRLYDAMSFNLFFILIILLAIVLLVVKLGNKIFLLKTVYGNKYFSYFVAIFVLFFWLFRNLPFSPFNWLAP